MGGNLKYLFSHFSDLWVVIKTNNSKLEASPFFFWIFLPVILGSTIANWFDLRLFLGTIVWLLVSYGFGTMIIKASTRRKHKRFLNN